MKPIKYLSDNFSPRSSGVSRGIIAGILGGLAGTVVKNLVEEFLPVRKVEQRSAKLKIIDDLSTKITGSPISSQNESIAEYLVSLPVGISLGAAYGYSKKNKEGLKISDGVIFGASTWFSTHETSLPLMGLEPKPTDVPLKMQANELFAYVLSGITTEIVRSIVSDRLKK